MRGLVYITLTTVFLACLIAPGCQKQRHKETCSYCSSYITGHGKILKCLKWTDYDCWCEKEGNFNYCGKEVQPEPWPWDNVRQRVVKGELDKYEGLK